MNGKLWFKAKTYGWGWTPATWQGWAVIALFIIAMAANAYGIKDEAQTLAQDLIRFGVTTAVLTIFLVLISYLSGEEPRWRWGEKDTNKEITNDK